MVSGELILQLKTVSLRSFKLGQGLSSRHLCASPAPSRGSICLAMKVHCALHAMTSKSSHNNLAWARSRNARAADMSHTPPKCQRLVFMMPALIPASRGEHSSLQTAAKCSGWPRLSANRRRSVRLEALETLLIDEILARPARHPHGALHNFRPMSEVPIG